MLQKLLAMHAPQSRASSTTTMNSKTGKGVSSISSPTNHSVCTACVVVMSLGRTVGLVVGSQGSPHVNSHLCHVCSFPCDACQGVIGPGGVQWMTAGRGIVHSEMPKVTEGNLWGFQLWINLPKKDKMVKPRYECHRNPCSCTAGCITASVL